MQFLLGIFFCGAANRLWGAAYGSRWQAVLIFSLGFVLANNLPIASYFLILPLFYFFRMFATASWLDLLSIPHSSWPIAFLRAAAVIPLVLLHYYYVSNVYIIAKGLAAIFLIPIIYFLAGKIKNVPDQTAIAEFCVGVLLGLI
jgi:hypothetical protein